MATLFINIIILFRKEWLQALSQESVIEYLYLSNRIQCPNHLAYAIALKS